MKVLIVDDEMITIKMLQNILDWSSLGLNIIGYANDGVTAYEMVLKEKPDIILSDIKMTQMNGLELVKKVKSIHNDIKFILMSAYAQFEYVKEAMQLGCSDYILKPIDENELEKTLRKIIEDIRGTQNKNKIIDESLKQLRYFELYKYLKSGNNLNKIIKNIQDFEISFENYFIVFIQQENYSIGEYSRINNLELVQQNYILSLLNNIIHNHFKKFFIPLLFEDDNYILIIEGETPDEIFNISKNIYETFSKEVSLNTLITFSQKGESITSLPFLYDQSKILSKYGGYLEEEKILGYNYNFKENKIDSNKYQDILIEIEFDIKNLNLFHLKESIEEIFKLTINFKNIDTLYELCYRVIIELKNTNKFEALDISYESLKKYNSLKELQTFVIDLINTLIKAKGLNPNKKYSEPIEKCLKILEKDYDKNISLDEITKEVAVSKNYFCNLFKKEVGINIWSYLTQVRLEQAKKLLKETDLKTYEIAFKVGYDNPSYFSKIFKKLENITPNEFREK